ncbi:M48 family metalloprotease [Celeribacter persicus]|uniref:Putative Zn-dependent protease n=1 Tax=Celeribacter persicus TaxID=1651082 RepID=A0A2T5HUX9_9RHOB|nr:M48 family metalloprotease [Celeribacter persicus]PTQ75397.1 putative Zn-dependent protease [Celeribacter persicus]
MRRIAIRTLAVALMMALSFAALPREGHAATILRDPDIEYALNRLAGPIYDAAGLSSQRMKIIIIQDDSPNAFVADNQHIFLHSGLILRLESAAQLQAVIAHEVAHITGGHITQRYGQAKTASTIAGLGLLLSGAVIAGTGNGEAAVGLAMGISGSAQRVLNGHSRAQEASADQAGIRYMARAGVPPQAMLDVLDMFRGQEVLSVQRQDPYTRTHPLSRERLRALKGYVAATQTVAPPDPNADYWYARARGKLEAFIRPPSFTLRRVKASDTSDIALMRRAVALHRVPKPAEAIAAINTLVAQRPKDPYYAELQGQILLESRQFDAAVAAYGRAASLAPSEAQIQSGLGRALLARGRDADLKSAIKALETARGRDPYDTVLLRHLATAYARTGQEAMAALCASEAHALRGDFKAALPLAKRASAALGHGTVGWNRAQDVIDASEQALKRR